jgi:hypothetical protein
MSVAIQFSMTGAHGRGSLLNLMAAGKKKKKKREEKALVPISPSKTYPQYPNLLLLGPIS